MKNWEYHLKCSIKVLFVIQRCNHLPTKKAVHCLFSSVIKPIWPSFDHFIQLSHTWIVRGALRLVYDKHAHTSFLAHNDNQKYCLPSLFYVKRCDYLLGFDIGMCHINCSLCGETGVVASLRFATLSLADLRADMFNLFIFFSAISPGSVHLLCFSFQRWSTSYCIRMCFYDTC